MSADNHQKVHDILSEWSLNKKRQRKSRCYVYYPTEHPEDFSGGQSFNDSSLTFRTVLPCSRREDIDLVRASDYAKRWSQRVSDHKKALETQTDGRKKGYSLFRRRARIVKYLINACRISKSNVYHDVSQEDWLQLVDSFSDYFDPLQSTARKKIRPFVTLVPNEKRELTQLSFDLSQFLREFGAEHLFTDAIRAILRVPPETRSSDQVNELVRFFKRYSSGFNTFVLEAQRSLCQYMIYDKYEAMRVMIRQGRQADCMYICLSGAALEKTGESQMLKEINPGDMFGEEDLKCACPRRGTVVTRATTEVVFIHSLDFRAIFNMSSDSHDPKYLEYCHDDIVLQHFPMQKLLSNPSAWAVLSYKFGKLIVKDSNDLDWIYIITAGEARILKTMKTGRVDMAARRKETQQRTQELDPFVQARKMVDFVAQEAKSIYKGGSYTPPNAKVYRGAHSAFPHFRPQPKYHSTSCQDHTRSRTAPLPSLNPGSRGSRRRDRTLTTNHGVSPVIFPEKRSKEPPGNVRHKPERPMTLLDNILASDPKSGDGDLDMIDIVQHENNAIASEILSRSSSKSNTGGRPSRRLSRPSTGGSSAYLESVKSSQREPVEELDSLLSDDMDNLSMELQETMLPMASGDGRFIATANTTNRYEGHFPSSSLTTIPSFLQLESLRSGNVFGLRSCLEKEERGPSVSLVSAGCEVLQINKKFFLMHADDALIALINVKHRAFPTEAELLDRLDVNLQWQEYKERQVVKHLRCMGRQASSYTTPLGAVS